MGHNRGEVGQNRYERNNCAFSPRGLALESIIIRTMHKILGLVLISVSVVVFALYSTWAILIPMRLLDGYPALQPYLGYFPEYKYTSLLPAALLASAVALLAALVVIVKMKAASRKKAA
tara:strand:- start:1183 stop:1539 length:357 start_codon:yes stop_codon:yes gene_type:complete